VALSFDDGPDPQYTPTVLDLLDRHGANATFFVVGVNALAHGDLIAKQRKAGHTFGNHTYDHRDLERLDLADVRDEIDHGRTALDKAGVPTTALFRPPKGYTTPDVRLAAVHDEYRTVFWDACVEHFVNHQPVAQGVERMLHHVRPGSVLLAHDGGTIAGTGRPALDRSRTMEALPLLLAGLKRKGLTVVDVPTLLAETAPPRYA
jgi:chitooligosaccharide deacetylase